jgi:hypothetical protein
MAQIDPTGGGRRRRPAVDGLPQVASRFAPLKLEAAQVAGRIEPAVAEQGKTVTIACTFEPGRPFPSEMIATLEGLPPRATASPVTIGRDARRVAIRVDLEASTPAGLYEDLACRLSGQAGGRAVVYRVGRGGRLEIHPAGSLLTGANGKPLSPLDGARRKRGAIVETGRSEPSTGRTTQMTPSTASLPAFRAAEYILHFPRSRIVRGEVDPRYWTTRPGGTR